MFQTFDGRIHFDGNMFWTAGLLFKHFDTTGIEAWDSQLDEMKMAETSILFTRSVESRQSGSENQTLKLRTHLTYGTMVGI